MDATLNQQKKGTPTHESNFNPDMKPKKGTASARKQFSKPRTKLNLPHQNTYFFFQLAFFRFFSAKLIRARFFLLLQVKNDFVLTSGCPSRSSTVTKGCKLQSLCSFNVPCVHDSLSPSYLVIGHSWRRVELVGPVEGKLPVPGQPFPDVFRLVVVVAGWRRNLV